MMKEEDPAVAIRLSISGESLRNELQGHIRATDDFNVGLSSIVQNHLDARGIDARVKIEHHPDRAQGHQIRARESPYSPFEIHDIVNQVVDQSYQSLYGISITDQPSDLQYFMDRLWIDDPEWNDDNLLIASDTASGAIEATRSYIVDFIIGGDFFETYELGGLDVAYSIVNRDNETVEATNATARLTDVGTHLIDGRGTPEFARDSGPSLEME